MVQSSRTTPTETPLPAVKVALDGSFGEIFRDLVLGQFALVHDPIDRRPPFWNPKGWFDFDLRSSRPDDAYVQDYERITYRIGIDGFNGESLKGGQGNWLRPDAILGKQVPQVRLLTTAALAATGPTCDLRNTVKPEFATSFGTEVDDRYVSSQVSGHRNILGMFRTPSGDDGETFLRAAMKRGMLIDTDHLSQNMRVDVYKLAEVYASESRWAAPPCEHPDGLNCSAYPLVGVHSKVRGLEIDPKKFVELRNAYGYNDEASRSPREIRHVAANGGAFALFPTGSALIPPNTQSCTKHSDCANYDGPSSNACDLAAGQCSGVNPVLAQRDFRLPAEISNDCDYSSKTFATKYLWLLNETRGRGLTPSTDFNGLISTLKPRYGRGVPWNPPCGVPARERVDGWLTLTDRDQTDFNLDGLLHIGLYPDFFQDVRNVGVQWEQMGPLFRSAHDYVNTWKRAVDIGAAH